jgi:hypothetical protein
MQRANDWRGARRSSALFFSDVYLFAPFFGYSVWESAAANGTSALNHFAKLSLTDSGANSAMRLV